MRMILQRVKSAAVSVGGKEISRVGFGALVLVGIERGDDQQTISLAAEKLSTLRVFQDQKGRMNLAADQVQAEFLIVSQFTLAASLDRGRRPSFDRAAAPEVAAPLVEELARRIRERGLTVVEGRFGAYMQVALVNDGPVTFVVDL
jgi:D-tyrosyl-tRNA(Tyr) deacylase